MKMREMCDLLGVSAPAVRLYEKYGAIHSFRLEENGYRYYYFEDIGPAIHTRTLRKLGFSLPEAARLTNGVTLEELGRAMDENAGELELAIRRQQAILAYCRQIKRVAAYCEEHLHQYQECTRPPLRFLPCEKNGGIRRDREGRALLQQSKERAAKAAAAELEKAEAAAAKRREEILARADKDCEELKKEARSHMGKATQAILGRVVGN